jgi:hypothetical protein
LLQGRIYSFWGSGEIKIWRPLSVTTNVGYDSSLFGGGVFFSHNNKKYEVTLLDFRETNVTIKSAYFIYVSWRPRGDLAHINSVQQCFPHSRPVTLKEGDGLVYDRW